MESNLLLQGKKFLKSVRDHSANKKNLAIDNIDN